MAPSRIEHFDLAPGRVIGGSYVVEEQLGAGWEGEVYRIVERSTGIKRAAKVFYPQRNSAGRTLVTYAQRLHRLSKCRMVIQYHHSTSVRVRGVQHTCLISELVEGELLSRFVARQPGGRLHYFEAMHLLYDLAAGLAQIHEAREYHGDLHDENILVARRGIGFDVKLVDFLDWGAYTRAGREEDLAQLVRVFYDAVGGARWYASQPKPVKAICCGLRRDLIRRRFPSARKLVQHLEKTTW